MLAVLTATLIAMPTAAGAEAPSKQDHQVAKPRGLELSETTRLADRRAVVIGDRFYATSTADGMYPGTGWHITAEMGGFWTPPIKVLDGIWFGTGGSWLGPATRTTSGAGYVRTDLPTRDGVAASRVDFVPDGIRAGLIGLTFTAQRRQSLALDVDAHSELMSVYPWGWTTPSAATVNLPDTGAIENGSLVFRDVGTPPGPNQTAHDWAAVVAGTQRPVAGQLGPGFRGPQEPPVICPLTGPNPPRCDDSAYGKGTGGRLQYTLDLSPGKPKTVWFAVAGSDRGVAAAKAEQAKALANPAGLFARKIASRRAVASRSTVDLPGDRRLQQSVEWSKQNLADSVQEARNLQLRSTNAGTQYPPPAGTLARARWFGAGWPDYPWMFGTDGEYTAFAAVAGGLFEPAKAHLRGLRDVSEIINARSGKVVHEVMSDGSVYFGANDDPGNTDETAKFPSAVALLWRWTGDDAFRDDLYDFTVRNMQYIVNTLDVDNDGWPEGLGNVEREGMGEEKLDNTVYTIRGLYDLADLAASRNDQAVRAWATSRAAAMLAAFENAWWFDRTADQYADSLDDPGDVKVFQRHWIGLTPLEAVLTRAGQPDRPIATDEHGNLVLDGREEECYTEINGLYHTGTGPTSAPGGNRGPSCDQEVSTVQSERSMFSLNTAIMAVAEGNFGRLGPDQQQHYTNANARIQLDPSQWEMPGAMPEIAPGGDFGANIDRALTDRSMVLQAWGAYGILWPVVHQQLGVSPDLGRGRLAVVPQIPDGQRYIAGENIRLGHGSVDVTAARSGSKLTTIVDRDLRAALTIGAVLPDGATVKAVHVNGKKVSYRVVQTTRGTEVVVNLPAGKGRTKLQVMYR